MSSVANIDEKFYENENGVYFKSSYPSQWFLIDFEIDGKKYNCCEKFMMAEKARYFGDAETEALIMDCYDPKQQKTYGRAVKNFDDKSWNKVADDIVYKANLAKFSQNLELKERLLATGDKEFVECSPYDKIWGNGLNITDTLATPKDQWLGTNRLGKAIMKVRDTLRSA
jgi:ribA/ribD-fused uncharacterized protein